MAVIQGTFTVNGIPRDGATFKLWNAGSFLSAPQKDTALPSGSPVASGTTGPTHGHNGGYRVTGVTVGEYYVSFEWNGSITYDYHALNINPLVNVKDFGALGDGSTDDTTAIQAAINSATGVVSGSVVYFPAGTYIIAPPTASGEIFQGRSNIEIRGDGAASVLKVMDDAGDYESVFGQEDAPATTVSNFRLTNLRIDQNASGNTTSNIQAGGIVGIRQCVVKFVDFDGIYVDRVIFDKCIGVNTIHLNGNGAKNTVVSNCVFNFDGNALGATAGYDNSAIYFDCENHSAFGNVFNAEFTGVATQARGCIESHNGNSSIFGNVSDGYQTMCNVVSRFTGRSQNRRDSSITVVGNTCTNCNAGIQLWPITGERLSNVVVANNNICLQQADFDQIATAGIQIVNASSCSGSTENCIIAGNVISFQDEPASGRPDIVQTMCFGIGLTPRGAIENMQVVNNVIRNAPVKGLRLGSTSFPAGIKNVRIAGNIFIDAGQMSGSPVNQDERTAIQLESALTDVHCVDNIIKDMGTGTIKGYQSIKAVSGPFTRVTIDNNTVTSVQGGLRYNVTASGTLPIQEYVNFVTVDAIPPTSGQFLLDDIIIPPDTVAGAGRGVRAYRCQSAGTIGTLSGVTGAIVSGSNLLTITAGSTSGIAVGDRLAVAGFGSSFTVRMISGSVCEMDNNYTDTLTGAVSFATPGFQLVREYQVVRANRPTTAEWPAGAKAWNSAPTSGEAIGWQCIGSGTPGTWAPMGRIPNCTTITGTSYLATAFDEIILSSATGAVTVALPASGGVEAGWIYRVKDIGGNAGSNNITIEPGNVGLTIDNAASVAINSNYGKASFVFDGTEWWTV